MTEVATKQVTPLESLRNELMRMESQFKLALPPHISTGKFLRVVITAIQNNNKLAECVRASFFSACMKAAQQGLLPDGREAVIVSYKNKQGEEIANYQPMVSGLKKLVRNSGEIATWDIETVHDADLFDYTRGDEPRIMHRPALRHRGGVIGAYSIAQLKSGEKSREWMDIDQIEKIRARSRAKDSGPWVSDYEEMCKKTVAKRHYKNLPSSTDLDEAMREDDETYESTVKQHEPEPQQIAAPSRMKAIVAATTPALTVEEAERAAIRNEDKV